MVISSYHTDKRIYVLLLLIVAMLVGMYVINFKKVTTNSQAASSADQTCINKSGDPSAYCKNKFDLCSRTGSIRFIGTSYTCDNTVLKNCCILETGPGIRGSDTDWICRNQTRNPAAYCVAAPLVKCADGFTSQGNCGMNRRCCVPRTPRPRPIFRPTSIPVPTSVPTNVPTPRPTAGTIAPNNVCPPPIVISGVRTCQNQGHRWGPDQNGAKTCYAICGNLYTSYCGNAKLSNNNVTPCCEEALSKPFLFSKVCCDKLSPDDIKTRIFGGDQLKAKQNCPNLL